MKPLPHLSPTPPHMRRYGWLRLYLDFPHHPKWRTIAALTVLPIHKVLAVATYLLCKAGAGHPRGSLAEFSPIECAVALDLEADEVMRIYGAFEGHGWIEGDFLVTWDERQPDREDPTNKARQQRYRDRRKAEREAAAAQALRNGVMATGDMSPRTHDERRHVASGSVTATVTGDMSPQMSPPKGSPMAETRNARSDMCSDRSDTGDGRNGAGDMSPLKAARAGDMSPVSPGVSPQMSPARERKRERDRLRMREKRAAARSGDPRNGVTSVMSRPDETRSIPTVDSPKPVDCVEWRESAAEWLSNQGLETVRSCGKLLISQAQIRLGRWRAAAHDDEALRDLIHSSAALAADGRFLSLVGEGVARIVRERAAGLALPFPPVIALRRESG